MNFLDKKGLDFLWEKIKALVKQTSPQKLSELQNDMGFLTGFIECDPTVPSWAKTPSKPSYTAQEVGALPYDTLIPSRTSELFNDSGFLTSHQSLSDYYNKSYIDAALLTKADVSSIPSLTGYATQQWVQNQGYLTTHQSLVDYYNKLEVDDLLSQKADIDDIPSIDGFATQQWVNQQGFLKEHQSLDNYATQLWVNSQGFLKTSSLATVATTGSYNDLSDKPTIPTIPVNVSAFTNDAGYITQHQDISGKADKSDAIGTLSLSLDSTNYKVTLSGTKVDGTTFTISDVIDLPLESVVVGGSYNDTTKKVVLTLQSGSTVEFSVADLVAGLQSEITSTNKLSADLISDGTTNKTVTQAEKTTWNNKGTYSKPSGGIPKTDLASAVQTSLGKADTALQSFTETDPVFSASDAAGITSTDIASWNAKVSNVQSDWNSTSGLSQILNKPTLASVATSGSYNDLSNKPTIPVAQIQSDWNQTTTTAKDYIKNKPNIYNNYGLYIRENDAITIATSNQSILFDDSGTEAIVITGDEAIDLDADIVRYNSKEIATKDDIPTIPTNVSAFTNDAGYLTSHQSLSGYATETWVGQQGYLTQHQDISGKLDTTATAKKTASIPFGVVDSTSTATVFTATVPGITELVDGTCVLLRNSVVTSASGFTINVNGLGAHHVFNNMTLHTADTTIFNVNYTMLFVYCANVTVSDVQGAWCCYRGYDANTNTIGYQVRTNSSVRTVTDTARYYKLYFTSANTLQWVPASVNSSNNVTTARTPNQRPIDPFGPIVYTSANTNYAAGANLAAATIWQQYAFNLGYSFGPLATNMTSNKPVYLKCAPQTNGSAIIDSTAPIVQALPSTEDGKIYIFLGIAYSASNVELNLAHPVYYYKDNAIRLWTNQVAGGSGSSSITIDSTPTSGSTNAVSSGGVYTALAAKANTSSLSTVATSGSYNDLSNKPTIPSVTGKEDKTNKVTSLSSSSTDTQYPSAKCVYDLVGDIQSALQTILGVSLISFTIRKSTDNVGGYQDTSYQAESGMTWAQWVVSDYNTDGYKLWSDIYVADSTVSNFVVDTNNNEVEKTDTIVENYAYLLRQTGSDNPD